MEKREKKEKEEEEERLRPYMTWVSQPFLCGNNSFTCRDQNLVKSLERRANKLMFFSFFWGGGLVGWFNT